MTEHVGRRVFIDMGGPDERLYGAIGTGEGWPYRPLGTTDWIPVELDEPFGKGRRHWVSPVLLHAAEPDPMTDYSAAVNLFARTLHERRKRDES